MDLLFKQDSVDLSFVDGDLDITSSTQDDLMQRLYVRFKTFQADLYWNQGYGIDYLNNVFGDNRRKSSVDLIITNEILKEELVAEITSPVESTVINGNYSCKFTVRSVVEEQIITYYILTTENGVIISDENNNEMLIRI